MVRGGVGDCRAYRLVRETLQRSRIFNECRLGSAEGDSECRLICVMRVDVRLLRAEVGLRRWRLDHDMNQRSSLSSARQVGRRRRGKVSLSALTLRVGRSWPMLCGRLMYRDPNWLLPTSSAAGRQEIGSRGRHGSILPSQTAPRIIFDRSSLISSLEPLSPWEGLPIEPSATPPGGSMEPLTTPEGMLFGGPGSLMEFLCSLVTTQRSFVEELATSRRCYSGISGGDFCLRLESLLRDDISRLD